MSDLFYYVDTRNERIGPVTRDVLEQLHRAGTVTDETLIAGESENVWIPFSEAKAAHSQRASLPPVPAAKNQGQAGRKRRRKKKNSIGWRTVAFVVGIIALFIALPYLLTLSDDPRLYVKVSKLDPEETPPSEIATAIESMPQTHHRIPGADSENDGVMLLFTGEDSVQIRAIPDHSGLYQVDVTRYGVVYDQLPSDPGTRNALTLVLHLGTEFK